MQGIRKHGPTHGLIVMRGLCQLRLGHVRAAAGRAVRHDLTRRLAPLPLRWRQVDKALASYEKAISLKPEDSVAYQALIDLWKEQGDVGQQKDALLRAADALWRAKPIKAVGWLIQGVDVIESSLPGSRAWAVEALARAEAAREEAGPDSKVAARVGSAASLAARKAMLQVADTEEQDGEGRCWLEDAGVWAQVQVALALAAEAGQDEPASEQLTAATAEAIRVAFDAGAGGRRERGAMARLLADVAASPSLPTALRRSAASYATRLALPLEDGSEEAATEAVGPAAEVLAELTANAAEPAAVAAWAAACRAGDAVLGSGPAQSAQSAQEAREAAKTHVRLSALPWGSGGPEAAAVAPHARLAATRLAAHAALCADSPTNASRAAARAASHVAGLHSLATAAAQTPHAPQWRDAAAKAAACAVEGAVRARCARALAASGSTDALVSAAEAAANSSVHSRALRAVVQLWEALGEGRRAEAALEALLARSPGDAWAQAERAWAACVRVEGLPWDDPERAPGLEAARETLAQCVEREPRNWHHHFRLGRAMWAAGGALRSERKHCLQRLLAAAKLAGTDAAQPFAWLGRWYEEEAGDAGRSERLYRKVGGSLSLPLPPSVSMHAHWSSRPVRRWRWTWRTRWRARGCAPCGWARGRRKGSALQ